MREDDETAALKRWSAFVHRPRRDVPRTYEHLRDDELSDLLRQTNQTIAILLRLDQKSFDCQPEAQRIRAMSAQARKGLRKETLARATRIRDEFRRRAAYGGNTPG